MSILNAPDFLQVVHLSSCTPASMNLCVASPLLRVIADIVPSGAFIY